MMLRVTRLQVDLLVSGGGTPEDQGPAAAPDHQSRRQQRQLTGQVIAVEAAQCREVDEYTPKLGSLTMENIVATDAQFAGCYFDGLPEQPIERVTMRDVSITFDPNAKEGQAAMADNRPLVKKLAIYAENVKEIDLHNVKIEGYEGERLHFANVGHFEED